MPTAPSTRRRESRRGAATVEFALIAPLCLMLFVIAADYSRFLQCQQVLTSCAHNGATYAAHSDLALSVAQDTIQAAALADAGEFSDAMLVDVQEVKTPEGYQCVDVVARYRFEPLIHLPIFPDSLDLSSTVRMRLPRSAQPNEDE